MARSNNPELTYGYAITVKSAIDSYLGGDKPYINGNVWTPAGWQTVDEADVNFDPNLAQIHHYILAPLDQCEDPLDGILAYTPGLNFNGDRRLGTLSDWQAYGEINPFDINGNNIIEIPQAQDPFNVDPASEHDQFGVPYTKARVMRHIITHELGHALGGTQHSTEKVGEQHDLMYGFTNDWSRDHLLYDWFRSRLRIHNPQR